MPDALDQAKDLEQMHRTAALAKHKNRAVETPNECDGHRYCIDCGIEITTKRLLAEPNAVRCIDCQSLHEHKIKHYRN